MRRLVILAAVGSAAALSLPAFAAPATPGCAAVNPGMKSCKFTIQKTDSIPAGVAATTTWKITNSAGRLVKSGKAGKTTVNFVKGNYTLTVTGKGWAGAGKVQK
jgi:hypothetical protein